MSRSLSRGLLAAPLLASALFLSACGGEPDSSASAVPPTTAESAAATSPSTPTTPAAADAAATSPEATTPAAADAGAKDDTDAKDEKAAADDDAAAKTDDAPADAAPAGDAADDAAAAPAAAAQDSKAAATPAKITPSAEKAQNSVVTALAAIETCWQLSSDYRKCQDSKAVNAYGATAVDTKRPKSGEVAVTNASKETFKIIATDKQGTRWVLKKSRSGDVNRTCKLASGKSCNPATW